MAKSKPLTLTQKYELALEYMRSDRVVLSEFYEYLRYTKNLTDDQIKQFEKIPF